MPSKFSLFLCSLLAGLFFSLAANAYEIIFTQFSTNNGLNSNFVNCVGQSANGYIWVGTQNGLQRYDGYRFTPTIRSSLKNRIPPLPVHQVIRSSDKQKLWLRMGQVLGLFNIGDYTFSKAEVEHIDRIPERLDFKLFSDSRGNTYLLVDTYKILVYNWRNNRFEETPAVIKYPPNFHPKVMTEDADGNIWMASAAGLGCYDIKSKEFYTSTYNPKKLPALQLLKNIKGIVNMSIDSKKRFFINSWPYGIVYKTYVADTKRGKLDSVSYEEEGGANYHELNHIAEKKGIIWGYGNHAFNIFDEKEYRFVRFYDPNSITYGIRVTQVYQLFEDRDQNIWVASDNGLYIISVLKNDIRNGSTPYFKGADMLFVKPLQQNRFILGSWGERVKILTYGKDLIIKSDERLKDLIYKNQPKDPAFWMAWSALEVPKKNEIWIGCQDGRLICYNTATKRSTFFSKPQFKKATVRTMAKDQDNCVWFGLQNGLLIKWTGRKFKQVADFNHVSNWKNCCRSKPKFLDFNIGKRIILF
jgi:ligand-binding sensor domain-containing protein